MAERARNEFEDLFAGSFDRCCGTARRITGESGVAEELAAEAFVRAWTRWVWLRRQESPVGWVMRVTTNLAIDHVRRGTPRMDTGVAAPVAVDDLVVGHLTLVQAFGRMPARQRTALSLHYLDGLEEADIAAAMGVSTGSVKTHLHRGRARLRKLLVVDNPDLEVRHAARP